MNNTNERIEKASFKWIGGLYIKITGSIETLIDKAGADRLTMSQDVYDELYDKYAGEMYVEATDENFRDYLLENGGISQVRFIHFIYEEKWYAITEKEAVEHKIKEDTFHYDAFDYGRDYSSHEIESDETLMSAYDFKEHYLLEADQKPSKFNRKIIDFLPSLNGGDSYC
jgi:hypothetical protein